MASNLDFLKQAKRTSETVRLASREVDVQVNILGINDFVQYAEAVGENGEQETDATIDAMLTVAIEAVSEFRESDRDELRSLLSFADLTKIGEAAFGKDGDVAGKG